MSSGTSTSSMTSNDIDGSGGGAATGAEEITAITYDTFTNPFVQGLGQPPAAAKKELLTAASTKLSVALKNKREWAKKEISSVKALIETSNTGTEALMSVLISTIVRGKDLYKVATDGMHRGKDQLDKASKEVSALTSALKKAKEERDKRAMEVQTLEGKVEIGAQLMSIKEGQLKEFKAKVAKEKVKVEKMGKEIDTLQGKLDTAEKKANDNETEVHAKKKAIDLNSHRAKLAATRADKDKAERKKQGDKQNRLEGVTGGGGFNFGGGGYSSVRNHCMLLTCHLVASLTSHILFARVHLLPLPSLSTSQDESDGYGRYHGKSRRGAKKSKKKKHSRGRKRGRSSKRRSRRSYSSSSSSSSDSSSSSESESSVESIPKKKKRKKKDSKKSKKEKKSSKKKKREKERKDRRERDWEQYLLELEEKEKEEYEAPPELDDPPTPTKNQTLSEMEENGTSISNNKKVHAHSGSEEYHSSSSDDA